MNLKLMKPQYISGIFQVMEYIQVHKIEIGSNVAEICDNYIIGEYVEMTEVPIDQARLLKMGEQ